MEKEYEIERTASLEDVAAVLRELADGFAGGSVRFGDGEGTVRVDVPDAVELEIELETEDGEVSVEVEVEWPDASFEEDAVASEDADDLSVSTDTSPVGPVEPPESLARFELFLDRRDEWRWRLVHRNGNIIATSGEGYT